MKVCDSLKPRPYLEGHFRHVVAGTPVDMRFTMVICPHGDLYIDVSTVRPPVPELASEMLKDEFAIAIMEQVNQRIDKLVRPWKDKAHLN